MAKIYSLNSWTISQPVLEGRQAGVFIIFAMDLTVNYQTAEMTL